MEKLTPEVIKQLVDNEYNAPVATIYCPMHPVASPPHITEDQIRLKNLVNEASDELANSGNDMLSRRLVECFNEKFNEQNFWESQSKGLLICVYDDMIRLFQLPIDTEEFVHVDDNLYLAPILGLLADFQEFYVLTVTQHNPQLYKGDMYGMLILNIGLPSTLEEGLRLDETNGRTENGQFVNGSSMSTGGWNARGTARNPHEEDLRKFWRMIDKQILGHMDKLLPLVLAGTDSETVEYQTQSKYPKILNATIPGSHTHSQAHELFDKALEIVREHIIENSHHELIEEYQRLSGRGLRAISDPEQIEKAAEQGRIETLLLKMTRFTTDTVRDNLEAVNRLTFPDTKVSKKMNDLAIKVMRMSGQAVNLTENMMPKNTSMAALLRY